MKQSMLSVVIPAYNEEKRLPHVLLTLAKYFNDQPYESEVIVVNDGSNDSTAEQVQNAQKQNSKIRLISYKENRGKGYAVKTGMSHAKGEFALFMDADNATPISEIEKLWPYIDTHEVIIGSRHLKDSNIVLKQPWYRVAISRLGNAVIRSLLVYGIKDTQCGFKLFSRDAYTNLFALQKIERWGFDMELLCIAQRVFDYQIKEIPVSWYNREESRLRPLRDAGKTLKELMKIKYNLMTNKYIK